MSDGKVKKSSIFRIQKNNFLKPIKLFYTEKLNKTFTSKKKKKKKKKKIKK